MRRMSAATCCGAGQRGRRGDRDGVRPGRHAPRGWQPGRRGLHRRLPCRPPGGRDGRFSRGGAAACRASDVPRVTIKPAAALSRRRLGRGGAWHGPRPGTGPFALWQDPWARARSTRPLGSRGRISRSRPTWPARSIASWRRPNPDRRHVARDDFGRLADFPESVARLASPTHALASRRPARFSPTWPRPSSGSPRVAPTSSTRDAPLHSSLATWPSTAALSRSTTCNPTRPRSARRCTRRSAASTSSASGPPILGGRRPLPDAQYPRAIRPEGRRPRFPSDAPPRHRGDARALFSRGPPSWPTLTSSRFPSPS